MKVNPIFWKLVQHELKSKGSWRSTKRIPMSRGWWYGYLFLVLFASMGVLTYLAVSKDQSLSNAWVVTLGIPYVIFIRGNKSCTREWDNDTYGWWLTLPYPRTWLIGAKFVAQTAQMIGVAAVILGVASIYGFALSLTPWFSFVEFSDFMKAGLIWMGILAGFTPVLISASQLLAMIQHSTYRSASIILWIVFMTSIGFVYQSGVGGAVIHQEDETLIYALEWQMLACIAISWVAALIIIRLSAYLLERKASI